MQELSARNNSAEPLGSVIDLQAAFGVLQTTVADIITINAGNFLVNRTIDFSALLNWQAMDDAPQLTGAGAPSDYTDGCDAKISGISANAQKSACFIVGIVKQNLTLLNIFQWVVDIGAVYAFIQYIRTNWLAKT
jgi:hypothetical protein